MDKQKQVDVVASEGGQSVASWRQIVGTIVGWAADDFPGVLHPDTPQIEKVTGDGIELYVDRHGVIFARQTIAGEEVEVWVTAEGHLGWSHFIESLQGGHNERWEVDIGLPRPDASRFTRSDTGS